MTQQLSYNIKSDDLHINRNYKVYEPETYEQT